MGRQAHIRQNYRCNERTLNIYNCHGDSVSYLNIQSEMPLCETFKAWRWQRHKAMTTGCLQRIHCTMTSYLRRFHSVAVNTFWFGGNSVCTNHEVWWVRVSYILWKTRRTERCRKDGGKGRGMFAFWGHHFHRFTTSFFKNVDKFRLNGFSVRQQTSSTFENSAWTTRVSSSPIIVTSASLR